MKQPLALPSIDAVVIGASAGGVDVLRTLLCTLPASFRPAVLVVIHLPPDRPSGIVSLIAARCALPVLEALDKQPIQSGTIVFAPPNYHLLVEPGFTLALSIDPPERFSRPAIDPLFESASIAYGPRLLALLLTGGSADGSDGLAAVRARGGTAWVQDPESAVASTMPAAGIARAGADAVLRVPRLAAALAALT
jgi:two-component system chemotaxis response regulator CheB